MGSPCSALMLWVLRAVQTALVLWGEKWKEGALCPVLAPYLAGDPRDALEAGKGNAKHAASMPSLKESTDTSHLCQNRSPEPPRLGAGRPQHHTALHVHHVPKAPEAQWASPARALT